MIEEFKLQIKFIVVVKDWNDELEDESDDKEVCKFLYIKDYDC